MSNQQHAICVQAEKERKIIQISTQQNEANEKYTICALSIVNGQCDFFALSFFLLLFKFQTNNKL